MNLKQMDLNELKQRRGRVMEQLAEGYNESDLNDAARIAANGLEVELTDINAEIRRKEGRAAEERDEARRHFNAAKPGAYETGIMLKPDESVRSYLQDHGMIKQPEFAELRMGALLRSMVTGPKTDLERRALSEGSDSAGGVTVPDITLAAFIDALRARQVCMQAGARTVPLTSDKTTIARNATDPVAAWRAEGGPVAEGNPTFDAVVLEPKSLAVMVKASRELIDDSLNIDVALERAFTGALAVELDRVGLRGSGTPPEPEGILFNDEGVNEVTNVGLIADFDPFISGMVLCWADNSPITSAIIMSPNNLGIVSKLKESTTDAPLRKPDVLQNVPMLMTTSMTESSIILGDFSHLIFGIRQSLRIEILRELYAENLQYGFLAHLRADVGLEYPEAFCKLSGVSAS